ncbi:serine protease inhibitor Kazal-type 12-like [Dromiciops gliroides]|uniref:serine protease inhibitor Kazal-type 12-like n=1 Tax=Dromiciops gliroides TaxID=33562 RepID=UPI001CC45CCA|nr:serine protease inhibitor Kazal-type 12-like [Dromiciops gliroides]
MTSSRSSMILLCLTYAFLIVDAVSQGGYQAQCKKFKAPAPGEKTECPNLKKPVCGTDGQTYKNLCEFCKVAMEKNGQLGYKHDGKC